MPDSKNGKFLQMDGLVYFYSSAMVQPISLYFIFVTQPTAFCDCTATRYLKNKVEQRKILE
jgi:hypothetical protein